VTEEIIRIVTDIRAGPEDVWNALTDPDVTERYRGGTRMESGWNVGSKILCRRGNDITDEQALPGIDPPHRMPYAFNPLPGAFAGEKPSRATIEIFEGGGVVRLVVTHDHFQPGSAVRVACREGRPFILSGLETLLETGTPLPDFAPSP
jgi:uncharacterized protein YndB with AHSA1/START domain